MLAMSPRVRAFAPLAAAVVAAAGTWLLVDLFGSSSQAAGPPEVLRGTFVRLAQPTEGRASLVKAPGKEGKLKLTRFETYLAPELFVYLIPGPRQGGGIEGGTKLDRLQAVSGDQQYTVPGDFPLGRHTTVVIWCGACESAWGRADLERT
jgi:Electron transfer DM13